MEEYFPADRLLELDIGAVMQIDSEDGKHHFSVSLVGVDNKKFVITTMPLPQSCPKGENIEGALAEGTMFEMKTIHNGSVVAFESTITGTYNKRLIISSFPEMIETRRLRTDIRFPCALSCDIRVGTYELYAVITNISYGGCLLNVAKDIDFTHLENAMNTQTAVELEIFFPIEDSPSVILANLKSSSCQIDGTCKLGVAFEVEYECIRKYLESLQLDSVAPFFK